MRMTVRTHSGQELDLENPDPRNILLCDICWSLAGQNRWNAHGCREYFVSDHVQYVAHMVKQDPKHTPADVLLALLHDAPEAYESDIPEPVRQLIRKYTNCLDDLSHRLQFQIHQALGITEPLDFNFVHRYDLKAREIENAELFLNQRTSLMYFGDRASQANRAAMLQDAINNALADYRVWKINQQNKPVRGPSPLQDLMKTAMDKMIERKINDALKPQTTDIQVTPDRRRKLFDLFGLEYGIKNDVWIFVPAKR